MTRRAMLAFVILARDQQISPPEVTMQRTGIIMVSEIRRGASEKCLTSPAAFFIQGVLPQSIGGRCVGVSLHVVLRSERVVVGVRGVSGGVRERLRKRWPSVCDFRKRPEVQGVFSSRFAIGRVRPRRNGRGRTDRTNQK